MSPCLSSSLSSCRCSANPYFAGGMMTILDLARTWLARVFAQALAEDLLHIVLDVLELDVAAGLAIGDHDQMIAELRLDHVTHLVGFQGEGRLGKRLDHEAGRAGTS